MSANPKDIYEAHIKPLPREEQIRLLELLRKQIENDDDLSQKKSILELHGLGSEIWQGVDANDYVNKLRDEWKERN